MLLKVEEDCIVLTETNDAFALGCWPAGLRAGFLLGGIGAGIGDAGGGGPLTRGTGEERVVAQSSA